MMRSAANLIKIAQAEVGYMEKSSNNNLDNKTANAGAGNYTKYGRDLYYAGYYNNVSTNGSAWCNTFVDWCFYELCGKNKIIADAMLYQTGINTQSNTGESKRNYEKHNAFYPRGQTPLPGDQIYFYMGGSTTAIGHTGIVVKVDATKVYTIEGNTSGSSGVVWNGGSVCQKSYSLNYSGIAGYGRPIFETKAYGSYPFYPRLVCPTQDEDWYKDTDWQKYNGFGSYYGIWRRNGVGGGNCTAYAWGRFWEALDKGLKKDQNLKTMCVDEAGLPINRPSLSTFNAGGWFANTADGYARGQEPELGAVMVWKNSGAGHVAVVEQIFYKDDTDEVEKITFSNSGWGWSDIFRVEEGTPPNWGRGSGYRFQGFIYPRAADKLEDGSVYQNPKSLEFQKTKTKEEWVFDYLLNKTSIIKEITIEEGSTVQDHLPNLEINNKNSAATKTLQGALSVMGYYTSNIDGSFGSKTELAVKQLQKAYGLTETGKITGTEWQTIMLNILNQQDTSVILSKGKGSNADVKTLQVSLRLLNYYTSTIDGSFGNLTATALKSAIEKESIDGAEDWNELKNKLTTSINEENSTKEVRLVYPSFVSALIGILKENSNISEFFMGDNDLDCDGLQYINEISNKTLYDKYRFITDKIPFGVYGWDKWKDKKDFYEYWLNYKEKYPNKENHIGNIKMQLEFLLNSLTKQNATIILIETKTELDENGQEIEIPKEKEITKSLYDWCQYYGELNDIDSIIDLLFKYYKISVFTETETRKTVANEYYQKYWIERELSESMYYNCKDSNTICDEYEVLCPSGCSDSEEKKCDYCKLEICPICGKYLIYLGIDDEGNSYYTDKDGNKSEKKVIIENHIHYDLSNLNKGENITGIKHKYNNKNINIYNQKGASTNKFKKDDIKGIILHMTDKKLNDILIKDTSNSDAYYNIGELLQVKEGNTSYVPYHYCVGTYYFDNIPQTIAIQTSSPEYKINQCGAGANGTLDNNYLHILICAPQTILNNETSEQELIKKLQEETIQLIVFLCKKYSLNPIGTHRWAKWEYAFDQNKNHVLTKVQEYNSMAPLNGKDLPYIMSIDEAYYIQMSNKKGNFLSSYPTFAVPNSGENTKDAITYIRAKTGYQMYKTPYDNLILGKINQDQTWLNNSNFNENTVLQNTVTSYYIYSALPGYAWLRLLDIEYEFRNTEYENYSAPCIYQNNPTIPNAQRDANGKIVIGNGINYPICLDNKSLIQIKGANPNGLPLEIVTTYTTKTGDKWIDRTKAEPNVHYNLYTDIKVSGFNNPEGTPVASSGVRLLKEQTGDNAGIMNVPSSFVSNEMEEME